MCSLPSATLGKGFAECLRHSAKNLNPVVNVAVYSLKIGEEVLGLGDLRTAFADEHDRVVELLLCPDKSLIEPPWNNVKPV